MSAFPDDRQVVWSILFENAVNAMCNTPKSISMSKLLYMASYHRYNIERILCKWFGNPHVSEDVIKMFGRVRHPLGAWGRPNVNIGESTECDQTKQYWPFVWYPDEEYRIMYTPIYIKYGAYLDKLRYVTSTESTDKPATHVVHRLLFKVSPSVLTVWWDDKTKTSSKGVQIKSDKDVDKVELSTLYCENSDELINELIMVPIKDRKIANDVGQYRAIYHTPSTSHERIIQYLEDNMYVVHGGNHSAKMEYVRNAFWLLSHAMLFERGSASITEMVCNVLWRRIGMDGILTSEVGKMADVEAILTKNTQMWGLVFDSVLRTRPQLFTGYRTIDVDRWLSSSYNPISFDPPLTVADIERYLTKNETDEKCVIMDENGYSWTI